MLIGVLAGAVLLAGCGTSSSSSSTTTSGTTTSGGGASAGVSPASYCPDVTNFKNAVAQLKDTGSPSAIVSNITKVSTTGQTAISAVKTTLGAQTSALKSSLTTLTNSVTQLTSSSTRASALQQLPAQVIALKTSATNFIDAAKCG